MSESTSILVGMSGGVDSSVAAALSARDADRVVGVTLTFDASLGDGEVTKAAAVAKQLGFEHKVIDLSARFRRSVLEYAWREYNAGRTPNPCAFCNRNLKFAALLQAADDLGLERVVTGHYARLCHDSHERPYLRRGLDPAKDQTYFLAFLTEEQLRRVRFPLSALTKDRVRELAASFGLPGAESSESQDVCVALSDENFPETLRRVFNGAPEPGPILDTQGHVLGTHDGIYKYTIGQRRGLGVAMGKPAFITEIRQRDNAIVLSVEPKDLECRALEIDGVHWSSAARPETERFKCLAQVRYRNRPASANVEVLDHSRAQVTFDVPPRAAAPGQVLAMYNDDVLIGAGWIDQVVKTRLSE